MQKNKDADKAIQILTIMVSSYTIGSIFYWIILKIMSLGRVLYYEFDLVYYDYQLSYSGKFMFLIYLSGLVVGALISLVATTFGTYLWNKIKKKFQNNNGTYRQWPIMLYYLATLIVGGYALYVVIINFFPNKTLGYLVSTFTILVFVLCYSLIFIFLQDIALKVNKTAKLILVMFILFLMYIIVNFPKN